LCSFVYLRGKYAALGPLMPPALAIINAVCRRYVLHVSLYNFVPHIFKRLKMEVNVDMHVGFRVVSALPSDLKRNWNEWGKR
jgi:hypothetical protein